MDTLRTPALDAPPLERYGLPQWIAGANPGAATTFSRTIDGNFFERVLAISVRLTPDANAANRQLFVEYRDHEDVRLALFGAAVTVPASDTTDFYFSARRGESEWEVSSTVLVPLDPWLLYPTQDWRIAVDNMQAGDTLTRIRFCVEQFYTTGQPR